jgi:cell wall-associated NlpC family hydrolase
MARPEPARTMRACVALSAATAVLIAPAAAEAGYAERTLAQGDHGRDVKLFQRYLSKAGYRTTTDGRFGSGTKRALRRFERAAHRRVDGRASRADQRIVRSKATGGNGGAKFESVPPPSGEAVIGPDGRTAVAPADAPQQVKAAIAAANAITRKPYRYGGGHGSFDDSGYDCSGAVSYALHGGGLLGRPLDSTGFESWGARGRGQWITVYANAGHAYAIVAGLRFDTSGKGEDGPRWRPEPRSSRGFVARHPAGL